MVFVPIQYRLGSLGLYGDGTNEFSGNMALFDMMIALKWISNYIQFFGGDSTRITVMGHGSGATAAAYLTTTHRSSRNMITGVIAMSGTPLREINEPSIQSSEEIYSNFNCSSKNEINFIECMRSVSIRFIYLFIEPNRK